MSQSVGKERGGANHTKDVQIVRTRSDRVRREIGDEEGHQQTVTKPQSQEFRHDRRTIGSDRHHPDRALVIFFDGSWRLHLLVGQERKNVKAPLQACGTQDREHFVLVG